MKQRKSDQQLEQAEQANSMMAHDVERYSRQSPYQKLKTKTAVDQRLHLLKQEVGEGLRQIQVADYS